MKYLPNKCSASLMTWAQGHSAPLTVFGPEGVAQVQ
jgi:hypothetical protein